MIRNFWVMPVTGAPHRTASQREARRLTICRSRAAFPLFQQLPGLRASFLSRVQSTCAGISNPLESKFDMQFLVDVGSHAYWVAARLKSILWHGTDRVASPRLQNAWLGSGLLF
jgi:hypothetical protein